MRRTRWFVEYKCGDVGYEVKHELKAKDQQGARTEAEQFLKRLTEVIGPNSLREPKLVCQPPIRQ